MPPSVSRRQGLSKQLLSLAMAFHHDFPDSQTAPRRIKKQAEIANNAPYRSSPNCGFDSSSPGFSRKPIPPDHRGE
jgi:hypothetical protein